MPMHAAETLAVADQDAETIPVLMPAALTQRPQPAPAAPQTGHPADGLGQPPAAAPPPGPPAPLPSLPAPPSSAAPAIPPAADRCERCGTLLAIDQRYCLTCGSPRSHLATAALQGAAFGRSERSTPPLPAASTARAAAATTTQTAALLCAVLVALGVGVLIGLSAVKPQKSPPQVIYVQSPGANAQTTETTNTQSALKQSPGGAGPSAKSGKLKSALPQGSGESIEKPASIGEVESAKKKSGTSGEQQSNELPNVLQTGG